MLIQIENYISEAEIGWLNGQPYYVAKATIIKEGILNGSKGKLFYPMEHIEASVSKWDHIPISLGHPKSENEYLTLRSNPSPKTPIVGFLRNPRINNTALEGDAWFHIESVKKISPDLYDKLVNKRPIEVSTGLVAKLFKAPANSIHNGEEYTEMVGDYQPDHLAVLLDTPGACSLKHGCGIHNSCKCPKCEDKMTKEQLIAFILENSSIWNRADSKELLDKFDVPALMLIKAQEEAIKGLKVTNSELDKTTKTLEDNVKILNGKLETALKPPINPPVNPPVMTKEQWLATAPSEIVGLLNYATQKQNEEKSRLVDLLVVNIADQAQKEEKIKKLMQKDTEELKEIASLMGSSSNVTNRPSLIPQYIPAVVTNASKDRIEDTDLLIPEEVDWSK